MNIDPRGRKRSREVSTDIFTVRERYRGISTIETKPGTYYRLVEMALSRPGGSMSYSHVPMDDGTLLIISFRFIGTLFILFSRERELSSDIFSDRETLDVWFYLI